MRKRIVKRRRARREFNRGLNYRKDNKALNTTVRGGWRM